MKDGASEAKRDRTETTSANGHSHDRANTQRCRESSDQHDLRLIKDVVTRYVGQLLYGCNDPTCTELMCDTGRRNTSQQPVRKYTPRSARSIAITLASGLKPRAHLCPRYTVDQEPSNVSSVEGPRDPSAFMQQFADRTSIRSLDLMGARSTLAEEILPPTNGSQRNALFQTALEYCTAALDRASTKQRTHEFVNGDHVLNESDELSSQLCICFQSILDSLPLGSLMQWRYVNQIVSSGCAYPQYNRNVPCDPSFNTWLAILDRLDHGPTFQLFSFLMTVLAKCGRVELEVIRNLPFISGTTVSSNIGLFEKVIRSLLSVITRRNELVDLVVWVKKYLLHHWNGKAQLHSSDPAWFALCFMANIFNCTQSSSLDPDLRDELFSIPAIPQRLELEEVARTWIKASEDSGREHTVHMLAFDFVFNLRSYATYFRTINHLRMRKANSDAALAHDLHEKLPGVDTALGEELDYLEDRYLLLNVSRSSLLQDTFDQLWQRRSGELLRPLRVRLGEEDRFEMGHDLGGVQVEFFNLVCRELLNESNQMFTTDVKTGFSYFRAGSLQPLHMFELCGLLFALAMYNGISLPVNFPRAFYHCITGKQGALKECLGDGWPEVLRSLEHIMTEDVIGIDYTFPLEANGLRLTVLPTLHSDRAGNIILPVVNATKIDHFEDRPQTAHARINDRPDHSDRSSSSTSSRLDDLICPANSWPGWYLVDATEEPGELTNETKSSWASAYAEWLTFGSVQPQIQAFRRGFDRVLPDLSMLPFRYVKPILEGSTHLDINELQRITTYEGFEPSSRYIQTFWHIVKGWPEEKQKQLLKFVTACERLPPSGVSGLTFRIQRSSHVSTDHLPMSSTCFGTLSLPKYPNPDILEKKLSLALKYGAEGFGSG